MAACRFHDSRLEPRFPDGLLEHGLVEMVSPPLAGRSVDIVPGGGKEPLPTQFVAGIRVLAFQGIRKADGPEAPARSKSCSFAIL
jgi:hypothetical protein